LLTETALILILLPRFVGKKQKIDFFSLKKILKIPISTLRTWAGMFSSCLRSILIFTEKNRSKSELQKLNLDLCISALDHGYLLKIFLPYHLHLGMPLTNVFLKVGQRGGGGIVCLATK
jgi:hypothetical protein